MPATGDWRLTQSNYIWTTVKDMTFGILFFAVTHYLAGNLNRCCMPAKKFLHIMENLPIGNIVAWIITGLLAIVTFFSQLGIKYVNETLKQHAADIHNNKMELAELKNLIALNTESDKYRMETLKKSFDNIQEGIRDIKQSQSNQQGEMKTLDKRLTDFIIDTHKNIVRPA